MRPVIATAALLFGAAMLLPAATPLPAFAQVAPSASPAPSASASIEPSGSAVPSAAPSEPCMMVDPDVPECHDAEVFLRVNSAEPVREWAIAVTGGVPHDDVLVADPNFDVLLTLTMPGESAIVEMTATLPAGAWFIQGTCFDFSDEVPFDVLVPPGRLVLEVVRGGSYQCWYRSNLQGVAAPTAPATDSLTGAQAGPPSGGWQIVLAVIAAVIAASLLTATLARPGGTGR